MMLVLDMSFPANVMNKEPLLIHVTAHVRLSVYLASDGDAAEICLFFRNGF